MLLKIPFCRVVNHLKSFRYGFIEKMGDTLATRVKQIINLDRSLLVLDAPASPQSLAPTCRAILDTPGLEKDFSSVIVPAKVLGKELLGASLRQYFIGVDAHDGFTSIESYDSSPLLRGEVLTGGYEKLDHRILYYADQGVSFVRWPLQLRIENKNRNREKMPTEGCLSENVWRAVLCARLAQEHELIPLLDVDILSQGDHLLKETYEVTSRVYDRLFESLARADVSLPGMILGVRPLLPGEECIRGKKYSALDIARATFTCLKEHVPATLGATIFMCNSTDKLPDDPTQKSHEHSPMFGRYTALSALSSLDAPQYVRQDTFEVLPRPFGFSYPVTLSASRMDVDDLVYSPDLMLKDCRKAHMLLEHYRKARDNKGLFGPGE